MQYLANIGITADSNGKLSLNTTTFEQALSSNFTGVENLLSGSSGIASLVQGLATGFTDPVNGIVASQTKGLQTSITGLNKTVSDMQANIDLQMASMQTEFENMNTAVAQMNSMQSYLSTQLSNL